MIVLPGLVNTHHHLYQTLTRCIAQDSVLFDWLVTLYPIWARLTPEAVYVSAKVGLAELMLSGCTTSSDHLYVYPNGCKIEHEIRGRRRPGHALHRHPRQHEPGPAAKAACRRIAASRKRATSSTTASAPSSNTTERERFGMVHVALAPCSPFSVTSDLMR